MDKLIADIRLHNLTWSDQRYIYIRDFKLACTSESSRRLKNHTLLVPEIEVTGVGPADGAAFLSGGVSDSHGGDGPLGLAGNRAASQHGGRGSRQPCEFFLF